MVVLVARSVISRLTTDLRIGAAAKHGTEVRLGEDRTVHQPVGGKTGILGYDDIMSGTVADWILFLCPDELYRTIVSACAHPIGLIRPSAESRIVAAT